MKSASKIIYSILIILLLGSSPQATAQTPLFNSLSVVKAAAVDDAVANEMLKQEVVGVAIGIIQENRIVYIKGYGLADRENRIPVNPETIFNWASNSKPLTAIAAMQLVDQGQLDINANIRQYVPEYPQKSGTITSRDLLCHQSGIPHYGVGTPLPVPPSRDPISSLDVFKHFPILFAPGDKSSYSSYAYILLSAVIQRAGGEPFVKQVHKRIAEPLGMKSLQLDSPSQNQENWTKGYTKVNGMISLVPEEAHDWKYGAGGFKSTIGDFSRFAEGLLNHKLVSLKAEQEMWKPQSTSDGKITDFGLGFMTSNQGGQKISHSGKQLETTSRFVIYPPKKCGVVVLCNCGYADPGAFSTAIFKILSSY